MCIDDNLIFKKTLIVNILLINIIHNLFFSYIHFKKKEIKIIKSNKFFEILKIKILKK